MAGRAIPKTRIDNHETESRPPAPSVRKRHPPTANFDGLAVDGRAAALVGAQTSPTAERSDACIFSRSRSPDQDDADCHQ